MITELRVFTDEGLSKFEAVFLEPKELRPELARKLAFNDSYTKSVAKSCAIQIPSNRLEFAKRMDEIVNNQPTVAGLIQSSGLWSWIAAASMESLAEAGHAVNGRKHWLHTPGSISEYRHMFASAHFAFQAHKANPDRAMAILCQQLGGWGEVLEQVTATRSLAGSIGAEIATELYYDKSSGELKSGSGGKGPGTPRRLVAFLNQIRLTVDIKSMSVGELLNLLPGEFARFR